MFSILNFFFSVHFKFQGSKTWLLQLILLETSYELEL